MTPPRTRKNPEVEPTLNNIEVEQRTIEVPSADELYAKILPNITDFNPTDVEDPFHVVITSNRSFKFSSDDSLEFKLNRDQMFAFNLLVASRPAIITSVDLIKFGIDKKSTRESTRTGATGTLTSLFDILSLGNEGALVKVRSGRSYLFHVPEKTVFIDERSDKEKMAPALTKNDFPHANATNGSKTKESHDKVKLDENRLIPVVDIDELPEYFTYSEAEDAGQSSAISSQAYVESLLPSSMPERISHLSTLVDEWHISLQQSAVLTPSLMRQAAFFHQAYDLLAKTENEESKLAAAHPEAKIGSVRAATLSIMEDFIDSTVVNCRNREYKATKDDVKLYVKAGIVFALKTFDLRLGKDVNPVEYAHFMAARAAKIFLNRPENRVPTVDESVLPESERSTTHDW